MSKVLSVLVGGGQKTPTIQATPLPPAEDPAAKEEARRLAEEERRRVMAGGRAANILAGALADNENIPSAKKKLLGN